VARLKLFSVPLAIKKTSLRAIERSAIGSTGNECSRRIEDLSDARYHDCPSTNKSLSRQRLMNESEPLVSPDPTEGPSETRSLLEGLRLLLPAGKKKIDPAAADDIARKVNLLALHIQKTQDEQEALDALALIGVAIARGSKDAAKRKPRPARWAEARPPLLATLSSAEERLAAIQLLASLRAPWAAGYALEQALEPTTEKLVLASLVKWATKASATQAELLEALNASISRAASAAEPVRLMAVLKLVSKELASTDGEAGPGFSQKLQALCALLIQLESVRESPAKTRVAFQSQLLALLNTVTAREPALLFDLETTGALATLAEATSGWSSSANKVLAALARRMLSIALHHVRLRGSDEAMDIRQLVQHAASVLPVDKVATRFISERQRISQLRAPIKTTVTDTDVTSRSLGTMQDHVASMAIAWDALRRQLPDPAVGEEVSNLTEILLREARLERIGQVGDVVAFQPLEHYLAETANQPPTQVRVAVPGVRAQRSDGSQRLVTRSVVIAVP
jgi:hypothetical protein